MPEWPREEAFNAQDFWIDPDTDAQGRSIPGVLLSDRIEFYIERVGLITLEAESEEAFWARVRENLRPASIDLQLGSLYYLGGDFQRLTDDRPFLVIPPNQIAFVSTLERLRVPLYLVGRFDLRIQHIYSGLVLGTGPQIDPGFLGRLSCPLYNLSDREIVLKYRETFATADFTKTTPFPPARYRSYRELRSAVAASPTKGVPGLARVGGEPYTCKIFAKDTWQLGLPDYLHKAGGGRQSSLERLEEQIKGTVGRQEKFESRFFALQLVSLIIFVVLAGTFVTYSVKWSNTVDALVRKIERAEGERTVPPAPARTPVPERR